MVRYQLDAEGAFALLRRWSSCSNAKLRHIASLVVEATTRAARVRTDTEFPDGPDLEELLAWLNHQAGNHQP